MLGLVRIAEIREVHQRNRERCFDVEDRSALRRRRGGVVGRELERVGDVLDVGGAQLLGAVVRHRDILAVGQAEAALGRAGNLLSAFCWDPTRAEIEDGVHTIALEARDFVLEPGRCPGGRRCAGEGAEG